jgi:menaquinone-dependent protoporphyrinogen oxidase
MRVLITYGSKRGGTEEIARRIGDTLVERGFDTRVIAAKGAPAPAGFDAAVIGGALYAMHWPRDVRRYVKRNGEVLERMLVWMFSSGPLDESAREHTIPPVRQVQRLMQRVGARGHMTFGGRLASDAHGFPASAMAKKHAGDWRDTVQIHEFATAIADELVGLHNLYTPG